MCAAIVGLAIIMIATTTTSIVVAAANVVDVDGNVAGRHCSTAFYAGIPVGLYERGRFQGGNSSQKGMPRQ
jgi:hypothetical protein